jgi:hypothetical protein
MATYKIISSGNVIVADQDFVDAHYPGNWELVPDVAPIETERNISGVAYLRRFTQSERITIRAAAAQSPVLDDYLKLMDATIAQGGVINLLDPDTISALSMLESVGILGAGRAAEILA